MGNSLTQAESRTHFAAWSITSAPLILGFDLTNISLYDLLYPVIANPTALSINSQWAGHAGLLVANSTSYFAAPTAHGASGKINPKHPNVIFPVWQVWRKPLASPAGGQAVLVINLSEKPQDVRVTFAALRLEIPPGARVKAVGVWTGAEVHGVDETSIKFAGIASHDSAYVVLSAR